MCYALSSDKRCLGPKYPVSEGNFVDYGRGGSPCWKRTKTSRAEDGKPPEKGKTSERRGNNYYGTGLVQSIYCS